MTFQYIVEIKHDKAIIETTTEDTLSGAIAYADQVSILGDLVVITEGYEATDGTVDSHDHVTSWYVN